MHLVHTLLIDTHSCSWACGLFVAPLIQAFAENTMTFELNKAGLAMRNALMAAIFNKCLRLNTVSLAQASTGKIVTLMSNDAQKIQVHSFPRAS